MNMPKKPTECKFCIDNPDTRYYTCNFDSEHPCNCTLCFVGLQTFCKKLANINSNRQGIL